MVVRSSKIIVITCLLFISSVAYSQTLKRVLNPEGNTETGTGQTYYFSWNNGSDANNCKSIEKPCKTGSKMAQLSLKPGDSVLRERGNVWLDDGTQWVVDTESGTKDSPIIYGSYGSGKLPIIKWTDKPQVNLYSKSWLVFDRLEIDGHFAWRTQAGSHHIVYKNMVFRRSYQASWVVRAGSSKKCVRHIELIDSAVLDSGFSLSGGGSNAEGIYIGSGGKYDESCATDILIKNVYISGSKNEPIDVKENTKRVTIDGCVVTDTKFVNHEGIISSRNSDHKDAGHVVKNCVIFNNERIQGRDQAAIFVGHGWKVYNNLIYDNKNLWCLRGISNSNTEFFFNTCYNNSQGFLSPMGINKSDPSISHSQVKDNLQHGTEGKVSGNRTASSDVVVDLSKRDFRLQKDSRAIGVATSCHGIDVDIVGNKREEPCDMGAYAYPRLQPDPDPEPEPKPDPVDPIRVGWCEYGCLQCPDVTLPSEMILAGVQVCKCGCADKADGIHFPVEPESALGPVK